MTRVELLSGWQGGEASISVEGDEILGDNDENTHGLIIEIDTALDLSGLPVEVDAGVMRLDLIISPAVRAKVTVAATDDQARQLAAAILAELGPE